MLSPNDDYPEEEEKYPSHYSEDERTYPVEPQGPSPSLLATDSELNARNVGKFQSVASTGTEVLHQPPPRQIETNIPCSYEPPFGMRQVKSGPMSHITKMMVFQWVMAVAIVVIFVVVWFGNLPFASAVMNQSKVLKPEIEGQPTLWYREGVQYQKKAPAPPSPDDRFPGHGHVLGGGKKPDCITTPYEDLLTQEGVKGGLRGTFKWMALILKWGTLIPMILSGVVVLLMTARFVWKQRKDRLRQVAMVFVMLADVGPAMIIIDVLQTFIGAGDAFILEENGKTLWKIENGLILNFVLAALLITLQISDCF